MICRLCLNTLDEQNAVLLFGGTVPPDAPPDSDSAAAAGTGAGAPAAANNKPVPESYLVQLISIHLYLCLSRDDAISTCICTDCCGQLESFHNFWKLVELKQTTLCSQFLEIDCDVNWSEEGDVVDVDVDVDEASPCQLLKEEPEYAESKTVAAAATALAVNKFPCMFCEKSFKMRRYLEEHVATHTGDRPIACPYCEMAFRCRSNMYTHVKSKHTTQWLKAREERDAAKSQNQVQTQPDVSSELAVIKEEPPPAPTVSLPSPPPPPPPPPLPLSAIKSDSIEAINLTMAKTSPSTIRSRTTRSSRRKTQSPKKVQNTECSASDGDGDGDVKDNSSSSPVHHEHHHNKRLKENELMLANYNAVAAAVVAAASFSDRTATGPADSLQQRLCASLLLQQQQDLLTAMTAAAASTSAATTITTGAGGGLSHPYSSVAGMLDKRRHRMEDSAPLPATGTPIICPSCGELPGQNHRCLTKPKYACEVCGKCFKMKRYLEEHFATHTGVKLHTCSFCPTEFRSKSNMYHHTKRKHKVEWERSRATRTAAAAKTVQTGAAGAVQEAAATTSVAAYVDAGHP
ncbi:zinc finger protein 865 [Drosophila pseudoobscura]|uniref:Zinc finger protein 865 n=1 Tax=Drosophila pseudoobscura pseudoobscura TaxID=46245 RepID=A0A6I8V119_DROPS|nr:zinc finger protein 865 [Drosophila pseudoobscura]